MNIPFLKRKDKSSDIDRDMKAYRFNLFMHRSKTFGMVALLIVVTVVALTGMYFYNQHKTYSTAVVSRSFERTDTLTTKYTEFMDYVIKYGQDGISCVNSNNQLIWSQSYTMQHPMIEVRSKSLAIAEEKGTQVMIFDESGLQGQVKTTLPIRQISVSNQGVLAVLLEDGSQMRLNLYDKNGTELVTSKFELQDAGYPLDISLSEDATKLAVTFLQVQHGSISSCLAFYNFDSVGENYEDHLVAAKNVSGIVMPSVHYMDSTHCVAVGTDGLLVYEGKQIPELTAEVPVEGEIQSVFYSNETVGLVLNGEEQKYALQVYNAQGKLQFRKEFDLDYTTLKFSGGNVLIYNENDYLIMNRFGQIVYEDFFEESISNFYTMSGGNRFIVMHASRTDWIRLE